MDIDPNHSNGLKCTESRAPMFVALAVAGFGVLAMLIVDHGPWNRPQQQTAGGQFQDDRGSCARRGRHGDADRAQAEARTCCAWAEAGPTAKPCHAPVNPVLPMPHGWIASADADKCAPQRRENGADQNVDWVVAKCAAVSAHLDAEASDFVLAGGVEQARQDYQHSGNEIHWTSSVSESRWVSTDSMAEFWSRYSRDTSPASPLVGVVWPVTVALFARKTRLTGVGTGPLGQHSRHPTRDRLIDATLVIETNCSVLNERDFRR